MYKAGETEGCRLCRYWRECAGVGENLVLGCSEYDPDPDYLGRGETDYIPTQEDNQA